MGNAGYGNATGETGKAPGSEGSGDPTPQEQPGKGGKRKMPPAGPHADPSLTNPDATPGTGALTPPDAEDTDSVTG